ncbi:MAG: hypothetical protein J6T32_01405 [Paludibacteraceae bacterium]|nr:hypothetical protein [Paludibacteraceae bacterium]
MKHTLFLVALSAFMVACGGKTTEQKVASTKNFAEQCNQTIAACNQLENVVNNLSSDLSYERICEVQKMANDLAFDYDVAMLDSAQLARAMEVDNLIAEVKIAISKQIEQSVKQGYWYMVNKPEELLTEKTEYPIYLERGEKLFVDITTEKAADIRLYNVNSHQQLRSHIGKTRVKDSIEISFSSIYVLEINPRIRQYASIEITYHPNSLERVASPKQVTSRQVEGEKGDFRVKSVKGIKMKNLFEEPRKFTLRGQLKAAFSGSYRAIVAVQVPQGATDILYSLRISTNEPDRRSDGMFHDNMETSYKRIKMLGLPIYESHSGRGIIATLLGENLPLREEDAYINMYVFYNAAQAKRFQDGADPAQLHYSVDYSTMGTQSCNGRIPAKGYKTIYFGFLNERMRYNNYVWLEAVSAVPNTEYFRTEYIVN